LNSLHGVCHGGGLAARQLKQFPVVALLGPRQVGKSTLARQLAARREGATFFDLEHGPDLAPLGKG
jgi:predicted AAA+ superfamily ATPase